MKETLVCQTANVLAAAKYKLNSRLTIFDLRKIAIQMQPFRVMLINHLDENKSV